MGYVFTSSIYTSLDSYQKVIAVGYGIVSLISSVYFWQGSLIALGYGLFVAIILSLI
jgi:hypothetical protein